MDKINNTTFTKEVNPDPKDRIVIEVGDSKQVDFKPQVKLMRWDNEINFSIRAEEHPDAVVEVKGKVIKYITPDYEVHQYEKVGGDFEFEWVLLKPPATNILSATFQSKELDFFYQPALTQEQKDAGFSRPDNVVGSYALYHKSNKNNEVGGKNYATGKAFHIYRPKAIDANSNEIWCNLDITDALLTVTVPQSFLDSAVYPVVVDPTIGNTNAGASTVALASWSNGDGRFGFGYAGQDGTVDSISVYLSGSATDVKAILNLKDGGGANSHTQVISPIVKDKASISLNNWNVFTAASEAITSGNTYMINATGNAANLGFFQILNLALDTVSSTGNSQADNAGSANYVSPESPWTPSVTSGDQQYSIYLTYTASSSSSIKTKKGLAVASVKTFKGLAIASVKTDKGLA